MIFLIFQDCFNNLKLFEKMTFESNDKLIFFKDLYKKIDHSNLISYSKN